MRSMTGYGRGECTLYNRKFIAEIKSVNHRYNDINIKIPRIMIAYEDRIKKLLAKEIFRGKTDVFISFETFSKDDIKIKFNEALTENYFKTLSQIKEKFNIKEEISLSLLTKFPDVISTEKDLNNEEESSQILECLLCAVNEALRNFIKMRSTEGETLKINVLEKLDTINKYTDKINERAPFVYQDYKVRLTDKLKEIEDMDIDESRIITEVMIFADKACIDEEITRLYSHINQMKNILNENVSVGRKLDFLVQEMNREANTISSKSNDLEITNISVELKSEIEKIREQVQNIE